MESDLVQVREFETINCSKSQKVKAQHSIFIEDDQIPYVRYISENLSTTGKYLSKSQKDRIDQLKIEIAIIQRNIKKNQQKLKLYERTQLAWVKSIETTLERIDTYKKMNDPRVEQKLYQYDAIKEHLQLMNKRAMQQSKEIQLSWKQIKRLNYKIQQIRAGSF